MRKLYSVLFLFLSLSLLLATAKADIGSIPIIYGATADANAHTLTLTGVLPILSLSATR